MNVVLVLALYWLQNERKHQMILAALSNLKFLEMKNGKTCNKSSYLQLDVQPGQQEGL